MALDLTLQSTKEYILERTREAIKYDDKQAAQEILEIFRNELPDQQEKVAAVPGLYDLYKQSWVSTQFICLASLAEDDFFDLIKDHLVEGMRLEEYDIVDKIGLRISFMNLESEQVTFMEQLLDAIKKNTGTLGTKNLKVSGRMALPTIASWLADYNTYPSKSAQKSDYEQIEFITKSPNAETLSDEDKKILLDILDCYDSLRNLLAYYRSLPEATEEYLDKPENLHLFYPGATFVDTIAEENVIGSTVPVSPKPVVPPLAPASQTPPPAPVSPPAIPTPAVKVPMQAPKPVVQIPTAEPPPKPAVAPKSPPKPPEASAPQQSYIVEESVSDPFKPKSEQNRPVQSNAVAEEIKNNLRALNLETVRPPLNVQDFLNERHNKGNKRGGIVFDSSTPNKPPTSGPVIPKSATPPPNLPTAPILDQPVTAAAPSARNEENEIAKKLAELRKRKQP
jgi:hypothetical protein